MPQKFAHLLSQLTADRYHYAYTTSQTSLKVPSTAKGKGGKLFGEEKSFPYEPEHNAIVQLVTALL